MSVTAAFVHCWIAKNSKDSQWRHACNQVHFVYFETFRVSERLELDNLHIYSISCGSFTRENWTCWRPCGIRTLFHQVQAFFAKEIVLSWCTPYLNCMVLKTNFVLLMHMKFNCVKKRKPRNQITRVNRLLKKYVTISWRKLVMLCQKMQSAQGSCTWVSERQFFHSCKRWFFFSIKCEIS